MQLKTILNRTERHKGFVYTEDRLVEERNGAAIEVTIRPDERVKAKCSKCFRPSPGYDTLAPRRFAHVPLWAIPVFFVYAPRRVECAEHNVVVELVPWAIGKRPMTKSYAWFLATWAKRMSWEEVAKAFRVSWEMVYRSAEMAVEWGLSHRSLGGILSIGIDEVLWHTGYKFLTVVYQLDEGCLRLLWVGEDRTAATIKEFFDWFGPRRSKRLRYVCSDMWKPYLVAVAQRAKLAVNIIDRFHIMQRFNKALNEVRAQEARHFGKETAKGQVLKGSRWCVLKRRENCTEKQEAKLKDLLKLNLRTVRAYLLREDFQGLWEYVSPAWAGKFIDRWCRRAMRSRLEPMKRVARTIRNHRALLLNWFRAKGQLSSGAVEGLNNKLKVITRRSYGFRTLKATKIALYHGLGNLPEPRFAHRFC